MTWRTDNGKPISPRTVNDYRSLIEAKIKPALGSRHLAKVDPRTLDAFYGELRRAGNAKAGRRARARVRAAAAVTGQASGRTRRQSRPPPRSA